MMLVIIFDQIFLFCMQSRLIYNQEESVLGICSKTQQNANRPRNIDTNDDFYPLQGFLSPHIKIGKADIELVLFVRNIIIQRTE